MTARPHITSDAQAAALRQEIAGVIAAGKGEAADGSSLCLLYDRLDKYETDQHAATRKPKATPKGKALGAILNDFLGARR